MRDVDALESGGNVGRLTLGIGGYQVLDPREVQRQYRTYEAHQPDPRAYRVEGEYVLDRESAAVDCAAARSSAMCAHW